MSAVGHPPGIGRADMLAVLCDARNRVLSGMGKQRDACAKVARDESAAEWREEVARHELRETRRRKRIAARGLTAADVREVVQLAESMTGGIGPRGVALHATVKLIGAELVRRVREGD